jgi:hypothetical protein
LKNKKISQEKTKLNKVLHFTLLPIEPRQLILRFLAIGLSLWPLVKYRTFRIGADDGPFWVPLATVAGLMELFFQLAG